MNLRDIHEKMNHTECFIDEQVNKDILDYALENARISNSKKNMQPFHYVVVVSEEKVKIINDLLVNNDLGVRGRVPKAYIIITVNKGIKENTDIDLGIVYHSISMSLCEKSCANYIVREIDADKIISVLGISKEYDISMIVAVGKVKLK